MTGENWPDGSDDENDRLDGGDRPTAVAGLFDGGRMQQGGAAERKKKKRKKREKEKKKKKRLGL